MSQTACAVLAMGLWLSSAQAAPWTLDALLSQTQAGHPLVSARHAERRAAEADLTQAKWQRYPSASVELGAASEGGSNRVLRLDQPLWTGGRITAGIDAAGKRIDAAQNAVDETRLELRLRVAAAASEALRQQARLAVARDNVAEHDQLLAMIRRRVAQEVSPVADQRLAESRQLVSVSERVTVEQGLQVALTQLSELVGQPVTSVIEPSAGLTEVRGVADAAQAMDRALAFSPGLRRLDALAGAADAEIQIRRSQAMPQVTLRLESAHGRLAGSGSGNRALVLLQAQPGAGLSALTAVESAVAFKAARLAEREGAQREVRERVQQAWTEWHVAQQRGGIAADIRASASDVSASYARQYAAGRKTWLDVLNAVREAGLAHLSFVDAQQQVRGAALRLNVLMGEGE